MGELCCRVSGSNRIPSPLGTSPSFMGLPNLCLSSTETGIPRASGRKWSAGRHQPLLLALPGRTARWGADPGSAAGRHPGRGFARRKHAELGEETPLCTRLCQSVRAAALGSGGRPAGVTHDVTDNDTSRVSHSDTAPEMHNVTPGTPSTPRSWRKHLAPRTLALRLLRSLSASPGALAGPERAGGRRVSPAGGLASG